MAEPQGPIEQLSAVTLAVADMGRSVAFYRSLGFVARYGGPVAAFTSLHAGPGYLNLQLVADAPAVVGAWGRVIFWVDDVDALPRAIAAGWVPEMAPSGAPWGERYFHLRDPDGHELSFARPLAT